MAPPLRFHTLLVYFYRMISAEELYTLLDSRRVELGFSQTDVGRKALGQNDGSVLQNIRRGAMPRFDNLQRVCDVLGIRIRLERPDQAAGVFREQASEYYAGDEALRSGYLVLPWRWPAKGKGAVPVAFSSEWIAARALLPERLAASQPEVSMLEAWPVGKSIVLVDVQSLRRGTGLWVFRRSGQEHLARIAFIAPSRLVVLPDNPAAMPVVIDDIAADGIELGGQVVWAAMDLERES